MLSPKDQCQCGVVGDPLVLLFDHQWSVLVEESRYLLSFLSFEAGDTCTYQYYVQTEILPNGLIIPMGVHLIINRVIDEISLNKNVLVSQHGVWVSNTPVIVSA